MAYSKTDDAMRKILLIIVTLVTVTAVTAQEWDSIVVEYPTPPVYTVVMADSGATFFPYTSRFDSIDLTDICYSAKGNTIDSYFYYEDITSQEDTIDFEAWLDDALFERGIFSTTCVGYVSFAPGDNGIGLRADINNIYLSMQYGNYWLPYGGYIKDHSEIALGLVYRDFTLGMAYHHYGEIKETLELNKATFYPISVELGARAFVGRFVAAIRYDVIRFEGTVDFGIRF